MSNEKVKKMIALYNNAISSWQYSSQVTWSRNAVMLTANSILIGIVGLSFQLQFPFLFPFLFLQEKLINIVLSSFGIIICLLWWILYHRSDSYNKYYLFTAREIEDQLFSDLDSSLLVKGAELTLGETIEFSFKNKEKKEKVKIPFPASLSNRWVVRIIIILFIFFYVFSILFFIYH